MRAVITAAGHSSRWNDYKGVRKHLVEVDGERLLDRLVRQMHKRGAEVVISARDGDEGYEVEGAQTVYKRPDDVLQVDRFLPDTLWNTEGRTVFLFGDIYFTDALIDRIVNDDRRDWVFITRLRRYLWRGWERNRSVFGLSFYPEHHEYLRESIDELIRLHRGGVIGRSIGLDLYRLMAGEPLGVIKKVKGNKNFPIHSDHVLMQNTVDESTDFDWPEDYDKFMERHG